MTKRALRISLLSCVLMFASANCGTTIEELFGTTPSSAQLDIEPVAQQTAVWCWAASAEMIFRHYGLPNLNPAGNYQCGIVAAYGILVQGLGSPCNYSCFACTSAIGNAFELQRLINGYGAVANSFGIASPVLGSQFVAAPLSLEQLASEIDAGHPVLAGVSFHGISLPGISEHAVVLVGYDATGAVPLVYVNDPFPYEYIGLGDPWTAAGGERTRPGQYRVPLAAMTSQILWGNTIWRIR